MNKVLFLVLLLGLTAQNFAQDEDKKINNGDIKTIFGNNHTNGGYGGLSVNLGTIDDQDALLMGVKGGWIINHIFVFGIGGYGFVNDVYIDNIIDGKGFNLAGGYGGLLLEPILAPKWPVHISLPIIVGAGGISYSTKYYNKNNNPDKDEWEKRVEDDDAFFVFEPGAELEFNMFRFMRFAFGAYYRFTSNIDLINTKQDVLEGWSLGASLKFGKF